MDDIATRIIDDAIGVAIHCEYAHDIDFWLDEGNPLLHDICEFTHAMFEKWPFMRQMNELNSGDVKDRCWYKGKRGDDAIRLFYFDSL